MCLIFHYDAIHSQNFEINLASPKTIKRDIPQQRLHDDDMILAWFVTHNNSACDWWIGRRMELLRQYSTAQLSCITLKLHPNWSTTSTVILLTNQTTIIYNLLGRDYNDVKSCHIICMQLLRCKKLTQYKWLIPDCLQDFNSFISPILTKTNLKRVTQTITLQLLAV